MMKERNMIQESDENNEQDLSSSVFDDEEDEYKPAEST